MIGSEPSLSSCFTTTTAEVIGRVQMLFQEYGRRNPGIQIVMHKAVLELGWVRKRLIGSREGFFVGFVGLTNTGKSTLLNGLFGRKIVPKSNGPCTSSPVEFRESKDSSYHAIATPNGNVRRIHTFFQAPEDLHDFIQQFAASGGDAANTRKVVAEIPGTTFLKNNLVLVDTPGFGAAQIGDVAGEHEKILLEYIPKLHQVFWVLKAGIGSIYIGKNEKDFYEKHLQGRCNDIIVTAAERLNAKDRVAFQRYCSDALCGHLLRYHFVSGKIAFLGKQNHDSAMTASSGVVELENYLFNMSDHNCRPQYVAEEVVNLCSDVTAWLNETEGSGRAKVRWSVVGTEWNNVVYAVNQNEQLPDLKSWSTKLLDALHQ